MKQYQPLYLKYRPQKLSELIGQEVVTKTLSNAIAYNKIVHAYLFCGPRGTGKTSTARILAKSLNCEKGVTVDPCNKCVSCESITDGSSLDVIEIDAASHRKVEDAEDLINRVSLGTYGSRYKIYIIDEVHMLTDHAFNALLKTLEEPPKNVIFILATTEEYKVIPTIISRCQKLDFKAVAQAELESRVNEIASKENIKIDKSIIGFISKRSYGCLRDAVSFLDQISVLQIEDKPISQKEVFELFGTVDRTQLFKLIFSVLGFDRKKSIELAEELIKSGKDISELFKSLLELILDLAKAKIDSNYRKVLEDELGEKLSFLETIQQSHLLKVITRLQDSQSKLRFALSQELQFMVDIMSILDEDFLISLQELKAKVEKLEGRKPIEVQINKKEPEKNIVHSVSSSPVTNNETIPPVLEVSSSDINLKPSSQSDLDLLWSKIVTLIESNPTKTLLMQSDSYLLGLTENVMEVALSKDMFLPRLEKDIKKKEMILKAAKLASNIAPQVLKFKILPRETIKPKVEEAVSKVVSDLEAIETEIPVVASVGISEIKSKKIIQSNNDDEFTRTVKDLLGAKEID